MRPHFSRAPRLNINSRQPVKVVNQTTAALMPGVEKFKSTYVAERRLLVLLREGKDADYYPAKSWNGMPGTVEDKAKPNLWNKTYADIQKLKITSTPEHYVRIMFKLLRGRAMPIPTLAQLTSENYFELVCDYVKNLDWHIRTEYISAIKRATTSITINLNNKDDAASAVIRALFDDRLQLTPFFKYCLLHNTVTTSNVTEEQKTKLIELASRFEELAALEYTIFPNAYDNIWVEVIPAHFKNNAQAKVAELMKQDRYCLGEQHD